MKARDESDASASQPNAICFTFDVEWAAKPVIDDVLRILDERGVIGTFFVTHDGVDVGHHERALHPNFRRNGDIYRMLRNAHECSDTEVYRHVIRTALSFAPEAKGTRSHSLLYDSTLLPIYAEMGIEYDSTYRLELVENLRPFWKASGIVEIPTYYTDYVDLSSGSTGFRASGLGLKTPGLKVLDLHPNLIYVNAHNQASYEAIRPIYHDPDRLAAARFNGSGARTLFVEALETAVQEGLPITTMGAINRAWRDRHFGKT